MAPRPNVPENVKRALWAESMGYCMNPQCHTVLIPGASIAEMAHIVPHAAGGDTSAANLILLCRNCHRTIDGARIDQTCDILRGWKANRNREIRRKFAKQYATFTELQNSVAPLLLRNGEIFDDYGPETQIAENHELWLEFEPELIANNEQMVVMLQANRRLLHPENQKIADAFIKHAAEFVKTRGSHSTHRVNLFPTSLCSIFGIAADRWEKPVSNLSALQNFVGHLIDRGKFRALHFEPDPVLLYVGDEGTEEILYLADGNRVRQIYWSGRFYRPETTEMRLENLTFLLSWLSGNSIRYEFPDPRNLTKLILNQKTPLVVFYEYCLSVSKLHSIPVCDGLIAVNLHNWNGAPVSHEASQYAESVGMKAFTQQEFFRFAHRNLK